MTPEQMADIYQAAFPDRSAWRAADFASFLGDSKSLFATDPAGFALGRIVADEMEIITVAVPPSHQGRGIGRKVMLDLVDHAQWAGCLKIFLEVSESNIAARSLYRSLGFETAGRRKAYYTSNDGTTRDALILVLQNLSTG